MTNELDAFKKVLDEDMPASPRKAAREAALLAAMAAFDEKQSSGRQGLRGEDRLRGRGNSVLHHLFRRRSMTAAQPRLMFLLAGSASVAALALAIVTTGEFTATPPARVEHRTDTVAGSDTTTDSDSTTSLDRRRSTALNETAEREKMAGNSEKDRSLSDRAAPVPGAAEPNMALRKQATSRVGQLQTASKAEGGFRQHAESRDLRAAAPAAGPAVDQLAPHYYQDQGRDRFTDITPNPVKLVGEEPVSTFSIDVDTASYAFVRASLNQNVLPQKDAVRVEELINYFPYDYAAPEDRAEPFRASVSMFPSPWNTQTKLLHVGIKGYTLAGPERTRANLVFLIDTSGSMNEPNKLPLLQNSMKLLLSSLEPDDTVAIVAYAGGAGTVLEPTRVGDKGKILRALDSLGAGGSTAGAEGIRQAYQLAEQNFDADGINRVILGTDGDFNVGISDVEELKSFVERKRQSGVYLSVLGFGMGNYNDELMQALAQNGNGNAAYIDSLGEARKVLVEEARSNLFTIAKDVKLQIEFNPQTVAEYRLIGYESRLLNREDFNNDKVDAGDIGAGHTVTAIYELTPVGSGGSYIDDLRYQQKSGTGETSSDEYAFLKIRYKLPDSDSSTLTTVPITRAVEQDSVSAAPREARFATAVAAFGQLLRGGRHTGSYSYDDVVALAHSAKGQDDFGYRAEFINLVRLARTAAAMEPLKQQ
jgi:Ca-activated chloride channel family protein